MGILKEMAVRGAYYIETGKSDLNEWSTIMIDEAGPNARQFLYEIRQWSLIIAQRKAGAQAAKINCWDFKSCGKEANGKHVREFGICPAYLCNSAKDRRKWTGESATY